MTDFILNWIRTEPVRFRATVVAIVGALTTLGVSFGLELTTEQTSAIVGVIVAVAIAVAEAGRRKVTPTGAGQKPSTTRASGR